MNVWWVLFSSFAYLGILFFIASWVAKRKKLGVNLIDNPYVYALSLAVYCTAWTFYGSIGRVGENGLDFLAVYLGPTLMAPLWWFILKKIVRIAKVQRITTIADFISSRYGKNVTLGSIATLLCILGVVPYIALQIKAIATSFDFLVTQAAVHEPFVQKIKIISTTPFYVTVCLGVFIMFFGTRKIDPSEKHEGMVAAIAVESVIKLLAFLIAGIFICYFMFDGMSDIFRQAAAKPSLKKLFVIPQSDGYAEWLSIIFLSTLAVLFLPRQFQISVVENINEKHINKAIWMFPLYLLMITFFVLPIAFAGMLKTNFNPSELHLTILGLPLSQNQHLITLFVYIGGFASATGMIIVETIALSTMLSNNLLLPLVVSIPIFKEKLIKHIGLSLIAIRRFAIVIVLFLAYSYFVSVPQNYSLVYIGLISFAAVAQFAPSVIVGMFWKGGTRHGALIGLLAGFGIWFYTLVVPSMVGSGYINQNIMTDGLFGVSLLKPNELFGLKNLSPLTHATFWSMLFNCGLYFFVSLNTKKNEQETTQAELFVDVFNYAEGFEKPVAYKGNVAFIEVKTLLDNFLGETRSSYFLQNFTKKYGIQLQEGDVADPALVIYVEKLLAGVVGSASARILLSSLLKDQEIGLVQVVSILKESQQLLSLNKELKHKTAALQKVSKELMEANAKLIELDEQKDDFLNTITHELRTPLTSIRAFAEIIFDNPEMDEVQKQHFLQVMITEIERLSRLITQVLDLEKFESGSYKPDFTAVNCSRLIDQAIKPFEQVLTTQSIKLNVEIENDLPEINVDEDLIVRVIENLFANATKYCDHQDPEITINALLQNNAIRFTILDNGNGLDEIHYEAIFDKFYQAKTKNKKTEGSGLGLAICKRIIALHNGKIWVQKPQNGGTCFVFELPVLIIPKT